MNELKNGEQHHAQKKDGLSPFCSMDEDIEVNNNTVIDFKFTKELMYQVEKYLRDNQDTKYLVDDLDILNDHTFGLLVNNGDWKHEHIYLANVVSEYLGSLGLEFDYFTKHTEPSDDDCYSAYHYFEIHGSSEPMNFDIEGDDASAAKEAQDWANRLFTPVECRGVTYYPQLELREGKKKPYDSLDTDAGNVEHNIAMFNKMNNPTESPSNNPVSGPFGSDVACGSLQEEFVSGRYVWSKFEDIMGMEEAELFDFIADEFEDRHVRHPVITRIDPQSYNYSERELPFIVEASDGDSFWFLVHCSEDEADILKQQVDNFSVISESVEAKTCEFILPYSCEKALTEASKKEKVDLEYKNLEVDLDRGVNPEYGRDSEETLINWTYHIPKNHLLDVLCDIAIDNGEFSKEDEKSYSNPIEWTKFVEDHVATHFDELFKKYHQKLLDYFEDAAIQDAEQHYNPQDQFDYDDDFDDWGL